MLVLAFAYDGGTAREDKGRCLLSRQEQLMTVIVNKGKNLNKGDTDAKIYWSARARQKLFVWNHLAATIAI